MGEVADGGEDEIHFLRTDDEIYLQSTSLNQKEAVKVALAAEGFGNRICYAELISSSESAPSDTPRCIFKLAQALSVRALHELLATPEEEGDENSDDAGGGNASENQDKEEGKTGHSRTLLYGNAIQLKHALSGMYLSCLSASRASNDKLAFDVGLTAEDTGESRWWTVHPASKQRSEGEKVRVGDDLILVSVATERYLHLSLDTSGSLCILASFQQTLWTAGPVSAGADKVQGYLRGGDVLRMFHGHMDDCLTVPPTTSDDMQRRGVQYEPGSAGSHARSLWRLESIQVKWTGAHISWGQPFRLRHITSGRYLSVSEGRGVFLISAEESTVRTAAFCVRQSKVGAGDRVEPWGENEVEGMGLAEIKYGDSVCFIQHCDSGNWLSYKTTDSKASRLGHQERKAIVHHEGHMDDGLTLSRAQAGEARSATVIRRSGQIFCTFINALDSYTSKKPARRPTALNVDEMMQCIDDLTEYFGEVSSGLEHEEKQTKSQELKNRQDLFQEEGMISLVLRIIDKLSSMSDANAMVNVGKELSDTWELILNSLYELLALMIRGNRANCARFSKHLDWLIGQLEGQRASMGILEVLGAVLEDSQEALNIVKPQHIRSIIGLLEKHGRNPKVLEVLCSLCVCNGVAVRANQNLICDILLPGRDILLQTALVEQVCSIRPNLYMGVSEGCAQYRKWYYELLIESIDYSPDCHDPYLRVGWGSTMGFSPYPGGGDSFGGNGVGDDLHSYGFDGLHLWSGHRARTVASANQHILCTDDIVSCCLDLSSPSFSFRINGQPVQGMFENFNLDGLLYPVASFSPGVRVRFLFGGPHGEFKFLPPVGYASAFEALLPGRRLVVENCKTYGDPFLGHLRGPGSTTEQNVFVPHPVDTRNIILPHYLQSVVTKLAENIHELWAMNRIQGGWSYGTVRDDSRKQNPCLVEFSHLPEQEKGFNLTIAFETLRTVVALGYHVGIADEDAEYKLRKLKLPRNYMMASGYKPSPLDLSHVRLSQQMDALVEKLADNAHNVWARERVKQGWTYGLNLDVKTKRNPRLVPFHLLDDAARQSNRNSIRELVRTMLGYGYAVEPPDERLSEFGNVGPKLGAKQGVCRMFRAEASYALTNDKWYFEFQVETSGSIRVGWATPDCSPTTELGMDDMAYVLDGSQAQKWHNGPERFGQIWNVSDIIGCLLDFNERTIAFTLNGEIMIDSTGQEIAFSNIPSDTALVPVVSLGVGQSGTLNLGKDIHTLKYFSVNGLQEGYQPFAIRMNSHVAMWFTKNMPTFVPVSEQSCIEVARLPAGNHMPPRLRVIHKWLSGPQAREKRMEYLFTRLNMPVKMSEKFTKRPGTAINIFTDQESEFEAEVDSDFEVLRKSARGLLSTVPTHENQKLLSPTPRSAGLKVSKFPFSKNKNLSPQSNTAVLLNSPGGTRLTEEVLPDQYADVLYKNDIEQLLKSTQYSFSVRIFPSQESSNVCVGWVTSDFHTCSQKFSAEQVRHVTITLGDDRGKISDSVKRSNCFVLWCGDLPQAPAPPNNKLGGPASPTGILVSCTVDIATGLLTFSANGKDLNTYYQVEPEVMLYPAVFALPTGANMFQYELGRSKSCMPISAAMFESERKNVMPQCPPRLQVQYLSHAHWARLEENPVNPLCRKEMHHKGWSVELKRPENNSYSSPHEFVAVHIPEENRSINLLELSEHTELQLFHEQTLKLYCAMSALGNHRVAHALCGHVDENQLMYTIKSSYLSGPLRMQYHNLLIEVHLAPHANARVNTKDEYIFPLNDSTKSVSLFADPETKDPGLPGVGRSSTLRPRMKWSTILFVTSPQLLYSPTEVPEIRLNDLRDHVIQQLLDVVSIGNMNYKEACGEKQEYLFVPLLNLTVTLLQMGVFRNVDVEQLLTMLDPVFFESHLEESEEIRQKVGRGFLRLNLVESVKLKVCQVLMHLTDLVLRHRVEAVVSFATLIVGKMQTNQKDRYQDVMQALNMSAAMTAKMTKEFRSPPSDQVSLLLSFKDEDSEADCPLPEEIRTMQWNFHMDLLRHCGEEIDADGDGEVEMTWRQKLSSLLSRLRRKQPKEGAGASDNTAASFGQGEAHSFQQLVTNTVVGWAKSSEIQDHELVRAMFQLMHRQFNGVGELYEALHKAYCISEVSEVDTVDLIEALTRIRSLLSVKLGGEEETLIIKGLNQIMNNKVFYQHPNLMRVLCMHETVMSVMVNVLGDNDSDDPTSGGQEIFFPKMVAACCRFLCYFCRISRQNQGAMFDHLGFLLGHSTVGLASPSMRGSTPLDVAAASVMDNNELALSLREPELEEVVTHLAECGLQSCPLLLSKGYPDIGWNPVEGERYLDFLKNAVFVNGESVEENANLVVRLLIRRPECLGPSLRGEGGQGLLAAITEAIQICKDPSRDGPEHSHVSRFQFRQEEEEEEEEVHMGSSILAFYSALIDLLGRCAPEKTLIMQGKSEALRIRSILRSLVPLEDLIGVINIPFDLPRIEKDAAGTIRQPDLSATFIPDHKAAMVLFLERVYGIEDSDFFLRLIEVGYLADMKAAASLDTPILMSTDMAFALNRYMCHSVLPLITHNVTLLEGKDHRASLIDSLLNTIYRMSKCHSLTKAQKTVISECLDSVAGVLRPASLHNLLRKLAFDVPSLNEQCATPIRLLTLHYTRCWKYYYLPSGGDHHGAATDEEKHLTMMLFWGIFDALSKRNYDPDLFGKALPCLCAVANALPPDYALSPVMERLQKQQDVDTEGNFNPTPLDTTGIDLPEKMESFVSKMSEQEHDTWSLDMFAKGWVYGALYAETIRHHPMLKPYRLFSDREKDVYRPAIREALRALIAWGWTFERSKEGTDAFNTGPRLRRISQSSVSLAIDSPHGYSPRPFNLTNMTLNRELAATAEMLAENFHLVWAKKKKAELDAKAAAAATPRGAAIPTQHAMLVPYDTLTAKEKERDRNKAYELLKFLQVNNYSLVKHQEEVVEVKSTIEKRFSFTLLSRLLKYVDHAGNYIAALTRAIDVTKQRRREQLLNVAGPTAPTLPQNDNIRFFAKVMLPFMESYFKTQQVYLVSLPGTRSDGMSSASNKEKEMITSLFCKMTALLRQKTSLFGNDAVTAVSCIDVISKCIDASTVIKSCPDHIKQALIVFFNHAAEDLDKTVDTIRSGKLSQLKTLSKSAQSVSYVTMALLPILTTLFEHLGKHKFGQDLLLDEMQVACYKILNNLYSLGTGKNSFIEKLIDDGCQEIVIRLVEAIFLQHRPLAGECLAAFTSAFPVAFLEPNLNKYNLFSIYNILSIKDRQLLGLPPRLDHLTPKIPGLETLLQDIESLADSGAKYEDAPEMIDIILPLICSYLPAWVKYGPDTVNLCESELNPENPELELDGWCTVVSADILNSVLRNVLRLIHNNLGSEEADWMRRIAVYAQPIMVHHDPDILETHFLPILEKTLKKLRRTQALEEQVKSDHKVGDVSDLELMMLEDYGIISRDIYAFYPLLIRYIDLNKSTWVREKLPDPEHLFHQVAKIFIAWAKSTNFRREEQNFVVQNEIDNMAILTSERGGQTNTDATRRIITRRGDLYTVATSLIVACLKRMLPVGLNMGNPSDYKLIQEAKNKFLRRDSEDDVREFLTENLKSTKHVVEKSDASWQLELYSNEMATKATAFTSESEKSDSTKIELDTTDNEKQCELEKKVSRLLDIAKVQHHLYLVEHPPRSRKAVWKKLMSKQRKRAVVSCFRMVPLYNLTSHNTVTVYSSAYADCWLKYDRRDFASFLISVLQKPGEECTVDNGEEIEVRKYPDPLYQLISVFNMAAMTTPVPMQTDDLYMNYANLMARSCHTGDDDEEEAEEDGDAGKSFEEKEREKQRLLYEQERLASRATSEMVLYMVSASGGEVSDMIMETLNLGIALLTGGNQMVQKKMLEHLQVKKDVRFFTSLAGLMAQCSVLDLDAYERCIKAENLGSVTDASTGRGGQKTMHDSDFTCALFRFLQLLCEGHNAAFQDYLRTQVGNNTTVNIIICTVDYLLRLQESISDCYWYYASKETIDSQGQENFSKAITVAKQVFNSLTEYIQGPCQGNQQALAHSRLWDAIVGFLHVFANMQMKLALDVANQLELLKQLLDLQQDMIVMLLSMLEGNVVNGTIGKQLVDTLIESSQEVELILSFFNMFLRLEDLTSSDTFREFDPNKTGKISRRDFHKAMEASKLYNSEEIEFMLKCAQSSGTELLDYVEFTERFHEPAADIGFNVAVLLTNLSEHMPNEDRLKKFMEMAGAMMEYFKPNLGRIEIIGGAKRIERVYFYIKESSLEQWQKPQVQESKRQFFFDVINEEGEKGKMEEYVNFCEDTIFEMQLAAEISEATFESSDGGDEEAEEDEESVDDGTSRSLGSYLSNFTPRNIRKNWKKCRGMTWAEVFLTMFWFTIGIHWAAVKSVFHAVAGVFKFAFHAMFSGRMIETLKRTTLADIINGMPHPMQEGVEKKEISTQPGSTPNGTAVVEDDDHEDDTDIISNVFGLDISKEEELIKLVIPHKPDAGFGDFSVEEAADAISLNQSEDEAEGGDSTPAAVRRRRQALIRSRIRHGGGSKDNGPEAGAGSTSNSEPEHEPQSQWEYCTRKCKRPTRYKKEEKVCESSPLKEKFSIFKRGILGMFARNFYNFKILALAVTFGINFMLLFFKWQDLEQEGGEEDAIDESLDADATEEEGPNVLVLEEKSGYMESALFFFAVLHSFLSFSVLMSYYMLKVPLVIFKREKEVARKLEFDGLYVTEDPRDDDLTGQWDRLVISCPSFPSNYWDKFVKKKVMDKYGNQCGHEKVSSLLGIDKSATSFVFEEEKPKENFFVQAYKNLDMKYRIWMLGVMFMDNSFLYILWYFVMSLLGHYNNFFFAAHLLDIAMGFKTLRTILSSVTHNGKQLVLTTGFLTVVVYLYTVIAFNFFRKFYNKSEGEDPDWKCHDMFSCFQFHLYAGVRAGGGIGDELEDPSGDEYEIWRILFDITFFFFVIVILLAIIQGLIIDAFGELRDQQEQVKEDMDTKCFICTIGNDYFDQVPHGFETHTMQEHNLANYMFFLMHLINKDETEYTGQETFVWNQYQERCWEFFPIGDCFRKMYENELSS